MYWIHAFTFLAYVNTIFTKVVKRCRLLEQLLRCLLVRYHLSSNLHSLHRLLKRHNFLSLPKRNHSPQNPVYLNDPIYSQKKDAICTMNIIHGRQNPLAQFASKEHQLISTICTVGSVCPNDTPSSCDTRSVQAKSFILATLGNSRRRRALSLAFVFAACWLGRNLRKLIIDGVISRQFASTCLAPAVRNASKSHESVSFVLKK